MRKIDEIIKERNQQWDSADRTRKKLLIARDVISMLDVPKYKIHAHRGYFTAANSSDNNPKEDALNESSCGAQDLFLENKVSCSVCARGAMMLSKFRFKGIEPFEILKNDQDATEKALTEAFTSDELNMIESMFETHPYHEDWEHPEYDCLTEEASGYAKTFSGVDKTRLRQLMERIIRANGDVEKAITCYNPELEKLKV